MSGEWINNAAEVCPVNCRESVVEVKFANGETSTDTAVQEYRWSYRGTDYDIVAYRVLEAVGEDIKEQLEQRHSHYHKDVSHLNSIDVYRVLDLFEVTDQAIGHAAKKLLVAGGRGHKDLDRDVQDVIDTLERWKEMRKEDSNVAN